jgi:hypothetical protein
MSRFLKNAAVGGTLAGFSFYIESCDEPPNQRRVKLHSKRVEKMWNYTRNEWRRCETTLETSVFFLREAERFPISSSNSSGKINQLVN